MVLRKQIKGLCAVMLILAALLPLRAEPPPVPPALMQKDYLYEVIAHLYRWYMDEIDLQRADEKQNEIIWVRALPRKLDEGDNSQFGEILLPVTQIKATVKKADYKIPELDLHVKNDTFKIINVGRGPLPEDLASVYTPVKLKRSELRDYLFDTRNRAVFPDDDLLAQMRHAVRSRVDSYLAERGKKRSTGVEALHCSPLSPVANELWFFWEGGRTLLYVSSDLDITNPELWKHQELATRFFDIDEQVVVSLREVPGSNAYLTRDQVGRALYNCIVLGHRYMLAPLRAE